MLSLRDASWSNAASWSGGLIPNGPTDSATFPTGADRTVILDQSVTLAGLTLNSGASTLITPAPGGRITLLGSATISAASTTTQTQRIAAPITLGSNLTASVGAGTLQIGGTIDQSGGTRSLTKSGVGRLILSGPNSYGNTIITGGSVELTTSSALGTGSLELRNGTTVQTNADQAIPAGVVLAGTLTLTGTGTISATVGTLGSNTVLTTQSALTLMRVHHSCASSR